jgi:hypothetical protein
MEGDNDLGSMRFEPSFAPHTGVVPRATGDGIDAPSGPDRTLDSPDGARISMSNLTRGLELA